LFVKLLLNKPDDHTRGVKMKTNMVNVYKFSCWDARKCLLCSSCL